MKAVWELFLLPLHLLLFYNKKFVLKKTQKINKIKKIKKQTKGTLQAGEALAPFSR